MEEDQVERTSRNVKAMIVGQEKAGKTSILYKLIDREYNEERLRSSEVRFGCIDCKEKCYKLQVFCNGRDSYEEVSQAYYRAANVFVVVFDLTDENSLEKVDRILDEIRHHNRALADILLMGNKSDRVTERKVSILAAEEYAFNNRLMYMDVSALEDSKYFILNKVKELADKYVIST